MCKSYTILSTLERGRKTTPLIKLSVARSASERRVGIASPTLIRRGGGSWLDRFWHDTSARGWHGGGGWRKGGIRIFPSLFSSCLLSRSFSREESEGHEREEWGSGRVLINGWHCAWHVYSGRNPLEPLLPSILFQGGRYSRTRHLPLASRRFLLLRLSFVLLRTLSSLFFISASLVKSSTQILARRATNYAMPTRAGEKL